MPDKKNEEREMPRKGKEDKSVAHDMDRNRENKYPRPTEPDKQFDSQPEFNENTSSRKDQEEL